MNSYNRSILLSICLLHLVTISGTSQSKIENTTELIAAMHAKYNRQWYKNVTFSQRAIFYKNGVVENEEIWHEAIMMPDKLIIKFNKMDSEDGLLFKSDSQFVYKKNRVTTKTRKIHDLVVLGFSVYDADPVITINKIKECGFDIDVFSTETRNDSAFYVVGKDAARFWIESETLLFTRMQRQGKDGSISDIVFKGYVPLKGGWIETEVLFYKSGQLTMREVYFDIKAPKNLSNNLFDDGQFSSKKW